MADLTQLPESTLQSIARQIGDRIYAEFAATAQVAGEHTLSRFDPLASIRDRASARFRMTETFEIWKLKVGGSAELALGREDLVTLARQTGVWHHQVKVIEGETERAVAFAQSYVKGGGIDEPSVRNIFFSPLADEIDKAIELADEKVPEDAVTRLLSLPEYKTEALWFVTLPEWDESTPEAGLRQPTSRGVIVISAPNSFQKTAPLMSLISSLEFMRSLASTSLGMGLLL